MACSGVSRIREHYKRRLGALLRARGVIDAESEVARLFAIAEERSVGGKIPFSFALARVYAELARANGSAACVEIFVCDAGLGGLARWLRGAGYEAFWNPVLDDAAVIREAQQRAATLITSDSLMMERGVLRDGIVPSVFVPSTLTCEQQLEIVFMELGLKLRDSRCMRCGGELRRVKKEAVATRIPPKTARWLDEYFVCSKCDQLFWRGTHWQRIRKDLERTIADVERIVSSQFTSWPPTG